MAMVAAVQAWAVPALPGVIKNTQPDGTTINVRLHGDEFYHYYTTEDGYTIVKDAAGFFTYAQKVDGALQSTGVIAHNADVRSAGENALLAGINKNITDRAEVQAAKAEKAKRNAEISKVKKFDYNKFKGLIFLVQFNDYAFSRSDMKEFYNKMVNQEGYKGYTNEDGSANTYGSMFIGSARDYYYDNSNGVFAPQFDIVGPITVPYSISGSKNNSSRIIASVLKQAVSTYGVNAKDYDLDGDGYVDMFYLIFAGVGSNTGEADDHIWPHASSYYYPVPGATFNRYACSCEYYSKNYEILDGIGTICHEFSHVLGLPDLYDTDYAEGGGQSHEPGTWDVMSGGSYNRYSRIPAGYSAYDKYSLDFAKMQEITAEGDYTLQPIVSSHQAIKLYSPVSKEFFLLENRQKTSWDAYIPGHGLMVARVDSTNTSVWTSNKINCDPSHNYYELLRAGNTTSDELASDPFPGTRGVSLITNDTKPSLKTWNGTANEYNIVNITETDGVISFKVYKDGTVPSDVEDFEAMPVTATSGATGIEGNFATWTFTKCNVAAPGDATKANGTHSVLMKLPSQITTTTDCYYDASLVSFKIFNTSATQEYKYTLTYSTDGGTTWKNATSATGETAQVALANTENTLYWNVDVKKSQGVRFRATMSAGSKTVACYLDDFTIYYTAKGQETLKGDVNGDGKVDTSDITALINHILGSATYANADVDGNGIVDTSDITALINIILS